MSKVTEVASVKITRTVTADFDETEYLTARGDRKGGGYRVARATSVSIQYTFKDDVWSSPKWSGLDALVEQQKADGSWSAARWTTFAGLGAEVDAELVARYMPTVTYTVTEVLA